MAATSKLRQAVGVFYEPERLEQALDRLVNAGFDIEHFGLLAGRETVENQVRPYAVDAHNLILDELLQTMIVLNHVSKAGPLFLSRGRLANFLNRTSFDRSATKPLLDGHLPDPHAAFLREQLDAGACLLWVAVNDENREKMAGTVLLQHSRHQVHLHDLSV